MFKKLITLIFILLISNLSMAESFTTETYMSHWGIREYKIFLPSSYLSGSDKHKIPVIVALHGCMQDPDSFAGGTRLNEWAEEMGFAVYYPIQPGLYNIYNCWNWFFPMNQSREMGEVQLIMGGLKQVSRKYGFDSNRTYALGMSAGAAMVNILGNCYPEKFKAIATHHGPMYKAAEDAFTAEEVVYNGSKLSPEIAAAKGYACSGLIPRRKLLPVAIIHGSRGAVMNPTHATQVEMEFKAFNDYLDNGLRDRSVENILKSTKVKTPNLYDYDLHIWHHKGHAYIKRYMIEELGHAWSGGNNDYEFNDPHGPDATKLIIDFFKENGL